MNVTNTGMFRPVVSASLSPNTQREDIRAAIRAFVQSRDVLVGPHRLSVEAWFDEYCQSSGSRTFISGRTAFLGILEALGIGKGSEVIVQAFTCVAVPNSILWAGARPVFCDIDETLNIDPDKLASCISSKTRAIVVQHTLGAPAQMEKIIAIARAHKILVIEDCAHSLGATYKGKKIGTLGDAAFFSFGRDKVISSVWGGAGIILDKKNNAQEKFERFHGGLSLPQWSWTLMQVAHPIFFAGIVPMYNTGAGKVFLEVLKQIGVISPPVHPMERLGQRPSQMMAQYPNALAKLLLVQLPKLDTYVKTRQAVATYYDSALKRKKCTRLPIAKDAGFLRYPILVDDPASVISRAKKSGILLGNWYHNIIDPQGTDFRAIGFNPARTPRAKYAATHIINLPTRIGMPDAERVVALF